MDEYHLQAVSVLQATGHVPAHRSLNFARALLAASNRVVSERVLLTRRALIARGTGHVWGADAVASRLVAPGRRRARALLAVREAEKTGLASCALLSYHVWLAVALSAHLGALRCLTRHGTLVVAHARDSPAVEIRAQT